jgi:uncharacterized membrane protein
MREERAGVLPCEIEPSRPVGRRQGDRVRPANAARMNRWDTRRLEAFTDGVFAIANTLLVLDIGVPAAELDNLRRGFANEWPAYLGFVTSFMTIGGIWMLHHGVFRRLRYAGTRVMRINLVLLMAVSFLPFPTRLVAEAVDHASGEGRPSSSTAPRCF